MLVLARIVYCSVPIVAFVLLVLLSARYRKLTVACGLFCAAYLGPYVLIAFYVRYWLALSAHLHADRVPGNRHRRRPHSSGPKVRLIATSWRQRSRSGCASLQ